MFSKLGVQLFTVRDSMKTEEDIDRAFAKLSEIGYTQLQTAGNENEALSRLARKNGLEIIGTHTDYNMICFDYEKTIEMHEMLGTKNIGVGSLPSDEHYTSRDKLFEFIENYNRAAEYYAKHGYKLTYHNHSSEFVAIDKENGKTSFDILIDNLDKNISFVLDTCWVANTGTDLIDFMERLKGRIDIIHLKDLKTAWNGNGVFSTTNIMCEIGQGNISWDKVIEKAHEIGVQYYVVEQDHFWKNDDPLLSLEISKKFLEKYMIK